MNDQRFTELLNLHLDHEATPAEAAELESMLSRDPARLRQYQAYRRMQHACAQLFEREHAQAPASFALEKARLDAERKVADPARAVFRGPLVAAFAGLAATAACLTLVLTRSVSVPETANVGSPSQPALASVATNNVAPTRLSAAPVTLANYAPLPTTVRDDYEAVSFADSGLTAPGAGLARVELAAWTQQIELAPLQPVVVEELAAGPRPMTQPVMAISRERGLQPPATQVAAFQFQR
jgi:hypothetical protein